MLIAPLTFPCPCASGYVIASIGRIVERVMPNGVKTSSRMMSAYGFPVTVLMTYPVTT
jgi:hypothetical protein